MTSIGSVRRADGLAYGSARFRVRPARSRRSLLSLLARPIVVRFAVGLAVTAVLAVSAGADAVAHGTLITSTPMDQDIVDAAPIEIVAIFSEPIDPELSQMELRDAVGATLAQGGDAPDDQSATTMRMGLPALAPGRYEVRWSVVTPDDGFLQRGSFSFAVAELGPTVTPTAGPTASPATSPGATVRPSAVSAEPSMSPDVTPTPPGAPPGGGGQRGNLVPVIALGGVVAAVIAIVASRRRRPTTGP